MTDTVDIVFYDQHLTLLPQRALFWREQNLLIITDPHFGKAAAFRRSGIAIPAGTTADDLQRLDQALSLTGAQSLLILGDLMHASSVPGDRLQQQVQRWRQKRPALEIVLVIGNHDRQAGRPPDAFGLQRVCDQTKLLPFSFTHYPRKVAGSYDFCGHLHPAVHLAGSGRQKEWLPCFYFGPEYGVLPAFGGFTGYSTVRPEPDSRVFVIAENRVVEIDLT